MSLDPQPVPTEIRLHRKARTLEIAFGDGARYALSCEFLRVHSPSAEVRGHGQPVLQVGKESVNIDAIEPVGQYAVKLVFDDGHHTGIYSWDYLLHLGRNYDRLWREYLAKLERAGHARHAPPPPTN